MTVRLCVSLFNAYKGRCDADPEQTKSNANGYSACTMQIDNGNSSCECVCDRQEESNIVTHANTRKTTRRRTNGQMGHTNKLIYDSPLCGLHLMHHSRALQHMLHRTHGLGHTRCIFLQSISFLLLIISVFLYFCGRSDVDDKQNHFVRNRFIASTSAGDAVHIRRNRI